MIGKSLPKEAEFILSGIGRIRKRIPCKSTQDEQGCGDENFQKADMRPPEYGHGYSSKMLGSGSPGGLSG